MFSFLSARNQKSTVLVLLIVLFLGKLVFRFDWNFFTATTTIFSIGYTMMYVLSLFQKKRTDIQNTTIILLISGLLFTQLGQYKDILILALSIVGLFLIRSFIRYRNSPIINPVIWWAVVLIILDVIFGAGTFTSWHWVNYSISLWGYSFPFGTIISVVLALYVIWKWKKYSYAVGFFSVFGLFAFFVLGKNILLDWTLYFFFGVMALEPKTTFSGKYQIVGGAILWSILWGFLHFHVIGGYVSALFAQNILSFLWRWALSQRKHTAIYKKWQKWFCVPCGFIYDPLLWDDDSGIPPWTEFTDIPDDWSCPVCGVTKSDFVPYDENHIPWKNIAVEIVEKKMLNATTLELSIETKKKLPSLPGQFVSFLWEDALGKFVRSYSIAKHKGNIFTFLIKIDANGRGGKILQKIEKWDTVHIRWVFGKFILKNTKRPKIFIATGTWLAPVYNMLTKIPEKHKKLYFSVSTKDELFYEDEIRSLENLESHIHITRKDTEGYASGRIDIQNIATPIDTEWYLCGNPKMIEESKKILKSRGFKYIFTEEFS